MNTRKHKAEFVERVEPSRWPSSNRGWRLGVAFGAAALLVAIAAILLLTLTEVCNV